jgi:hypothetical protein
MPSVPDHVREAARLAPDHWFGLIDPAWPGEGAPPDRAMVGEWRSDADGEIVAWRDNPDYRPSPAALDWPEPADPVDAAVQLAATGYGPAEDVTRALADAQVAVFRAPDGGFMTALAPDNRTPVVPVFTSPAYLHLAGRLAFETIKAPDLLDQLPEGHLIYLNPSGPVSMTVEPAVLRHAIDAAPPPDVDSPGAFDGAASLAAPTPQAPPVPGPPAPARPPATIAARPPVTAAPRAARITSTVPTPRNLL